MADPRSPVIQRLMNQKTILGIVIGAVVVIAVLVALVVFQQGPLSRTQVAAPSGGGTGGAGGGVDERVVLVESTNVDGPPGCDGCEELEIDFVASVGQCPEASAAGTDCGVEDFPTKRTENQGTVIVTANPQWSVTLYDWESDSMEEAERNGSQLPAGVCGTGETQQGCAITAAKLPSVKYAAHILCAAADSLTGARVCAYVDKARDENGVLVDVDKAYLVEPSTGTPLTIETSVRVHARYPTEESVARIEAGSPERHLGFVGRLLKEWASLVLGHEKNHVSVFATAVDDTVKNMQDPRLHLPESFTVPPGEDPAKVGSALAAAGVRAEHNRIWEQYKKSQKAVEGDTAAPWEQWRRTDLLAGQETVGSTRLTYWWYWFDAPGAPGGKADLEYFKKQGYLIIGP